MTGSSRETPAPVDERLVRRDQAPLPAGAFLRVQSINRGKSPARNLRYYVTDAGDVYESGHSQDTGDWQTPFDQGWPAAPTRRLDAEAVDKLKALVRHDFAAEESYQSDATVEDGVFVVVTARIGGSAIHEVIYESAFSPVVREILRLGNG